MRKDWHHGGKSAHARGYGVQWQKLRSLMLGQEPLCRLCKAEGRTAAATDLDHVVPKAKGGTDDPANLQPLCRACHDAKTRRDSGARARGCDASGMPTARGHHWNRSS